MTVELVSQEQFNRMLIEQAADMPNAVRTGAVCPSCGSASGRLFRQLLLAVDVSHLCMAPGNLMVGATVRLLDGDTVSATSEHLQGDLDEEELVDTLARLSLAARKVAK